MRYPLQGKKKNGKGVFQVEGARWAWVLIWGRPMGLDDKLFPWLKSWQERGRGEPGGRGWWRAFDSTATHDARLRCGLRGGKPCGPGPRISALREKKRECAGFHAREEGSRDSPPCPMTGSCGLAGISASLHHLSASPGEEWREGECRTWWNWEIPPVKPNWGQGGRNRICQVTWGHNKGLNGGPGSSPHKHCLAPLLPASLRRLHGHQPPLPLFPPPHQPPYCVCELLGAHRGGSHRQVRHAIHVKVQHSHSRAKSTWGLKRHQLLPLGRATTFWRAHLTPWGPHQAPRTENKTVACS